jgi:hypothetical protein
MARRRPAAGDARNGRRPKTVLTDQDAVLVREPATATPAPADDP